MRGWLRCPTYKQAAPKSVVVNRIGSPTEVMQWVATGIIITGLVVIGTKERAWTFLRATTSEKREETASTAVRKATAQTLLAESPRLESFETSEFLLATAVDLYERKHAAMAVLDDKAQKLVAFIGGGAAIFVSLGGFRAILTPLLVMSALCFLGSLGFALVALVPRDTEIPTVSEYNSPKVLETPTFRAKVARQLIETWEDIALQVRPILKRKGLAVYFSMVLVTVGATGLLTNFLLLAGNSRPAGAQVLRCSSSVTWRRPDRLTLTCEEPKP